MNEAKIRIDRLIECREKLGISKREASKRMKMSQPAYLRYELGQRQPSIHVVQTMAQVYSTSVDYLLGLTDDNSPDSIMVRKKDDPELFQIIQSYKNNSGAKDRLNAYYRRISKTLE